MSSEPTPPDAATWVQVLAEKEARALDSPFRIVQASLRYRRFDGRMSAEVTRVSFQRGDSVGVLLHDPRHDTVLLVRQFRYPVYAGLAPEARQGERARQAWLLEVVAGVLDAGLAMRQVAHKELLEEAGYVVQGEMQPIATFYASPGGTSERIALFLGEVDLRRPPRQESGVAAEGEDTQVVVLPLREALDMIARGEICDAKTIIALQHLALRRMVGGRQKAGFEIPA